MASQDIAEYVQSCQETDQKYFDLDLWSYSGFSSLSQIKFSCDVLRYRLNKLPKFIFDFSTLGRAKIGSIDVTMFMNYEGPIAIFVNHFNGFELDTERPFLEHGPNFNVFGLLIVNLMFTVGDFKFYYQDNLVDADLCDVEVFQDADIRLFSQTEKAMIFFKNDIDFRTPVCPYAFKNANMGAFSIIKSTNTFFIRNAMTFLEVKNSRNVSIDLNATIQELELFEVEKFYVDSKTISPHVFANTLRVTIEGQLVGIDPETFKSLGKLYSIRLVLRSARDFFHASDNKWMASLHILAKEFMDRQEVEAFIAKGEYNLESFFFLLVAENSNSAAYKYPEEDLCLFRHIPMKKIIITYLYSSVEETANNSHLHPVSSTLKLLLRNRKLVNMPLSSFNYSSVVLYPIIFEDFVYNETDLLKSIENCNTTLFSSIPIQGGIYFNYFDFFYAFEWLEFLGPIITFPIIAAVSFSFNLIIILVITSKKNKALKLFEAKMFDYILVNSAFNCLECFIYEFRLIGMCMGHYSVYCSTVRVKAWLFTIIFNGLFSEAIKTASIITGLLFSIVRYAETSQTDNRFMKKLYNTKIKKVVMMVLILSIIMSTAKMFEYQIYFLNFDYDFPSPFFLSFRDKTPASYVELVFYYLHYIINDFVILIINLVVDIKLVFIIKANLKQKIENEKNFLEPGSPSNFSSEKKISKMEENLKKKKSVENKANALIVANVFIYFFCRIPELVGTLVFPFSQSLFPVGFCSEFLICYLIYNTMEYMYMLSYAFTILICYKFNSTFSNRIQKPF